MPLISGWQEAATNDPNQLHLWAEVFQSRLKHWGISTGKPNDILVLDVDVKGGGLETIKSYDVPATMSQRTPSGGVHYFFRYPKNGQSFGNRVRFLPGLDTRGDGGYVLHYGVDNTPIAEAPNWLLAVLSQGPQALAGQPIQVSPEIALKLIEGALQTIKDAPDGERNNTLNTESFKVGQLVASGSVTKEFAEAALLKASHECGLPDYESKRTIASALDGGVKKPMTAPFGAPQASFPIPPPPQPEGRWTPVLFTRQDLLNTSKLKKPQLFRDWSTEDIHITTADGGTGKTTLKLFEAVCLALGERFLGFDCISPGKTLFITGEDTAPKLGAMIGQIVRQMGLFEPFPGNAEKIQRVLDSIVVKKDSDLCLIVKDRQGFLHPDQNAMRKVLEAIDDVRPKLIVFDPISSFWGSESALNDMAKAVSKFMSELVERSQSCVEIINHMGKQSSTNKDMSQFAGRGGTGLPSHARVSRVLRPVFDDEFTDLTGEILNERQSAMMCNVNKFSDGSPLYNKPFLILRDGFLFIRKDMTDQKAKEVEKQLSDLERVFQFVKEARAQDKYPTVPITVAHFMACGNPVSEARIKRALNLLTFQGHMGEMLKLIENPDMMMRDRAYIIVDSEGREV